MKKYDSLSVEKQVKLVRENASNFHEITNPSKEVCLEFLNHGSKNIKYIENQDLDMCIYATNKYMEEHGYSSTLKYLKYQNEYIAKKFIEDSIYNFSDIKEEFQTNEMCWMALKEDSRMFEYIKNPTDEMIEYAISKDGYNIRYIPKNEQTHELCLLAVKNAGCALKHCVYKDYEICKSAILKNSHAVEYIEYSDELSDEQLKALYTMAIRENGITYEYVPYRFSSYQMQLEAVKNNPGSLRYMRRNQTLELCEEAIKHRDCRTLCCVNKEFLTYDFCLKAVSYNYENFYDVPYILKDTYRMHMEVIKQNAILLVDMENQDLELCLEALNTLVNSDEKKCRYYNDEYLDRTDIWNPYEDEEYRKKLKEERYKECELAYNIDEALSNTGFLGYFIEYFNAKVLIYLMDENIFNIFVKKYNSSDVILRFKDKYYRFYQSIITNIQDEDVNLEEYVDARDFNLEKYLEQQKCLAYNDTNTSYMEDDWDDIPF